MNMCPLSIAMCIIVIHKAEPSIFRDVPTSSANGTQKFMSFYGVGDGKYYTAL
jgi:hypothetical protein